jgi:hypothetical protein
VPEAFQARPAWTTQQRPVTDTRAFREEIQPSLFENG